MSNTPTELDAIRDRYARRAAVPVDRYSIFNPEVQRRVQERQRAVTRMLVKHGVSTLAGLDVIEVGCGGGGNLIDFLGLGASPERLVGNDLLLDRLDLARRVLPAAVRLLPGDASALTIPDESFDIVYQATVFSSILDDQLQAQVAAAMWRWLRPGGAVLWYDFTYDNPANRDVRGVTLRRLHELFPAAHIDARRVTLAPPIARAVCRLHPALYPLFNALPLLRTHRLVWLQKPVAA